jgi:uncharacterized protein DUF6920
VYTSFPGPFQRDSGVGGEKPLRASGIFRYPFRNIPQFSLPFPLNHAFYRGTLIAQNEERPFKRVSTASGSESRSRSEPLTTARGAGYERLKGERMIIKLLIVFGVLIVVAITALAILRRRDDGKVDIIWRSLEATPTNQAFTEDLVSDLPAPARRYLLHAILPGTPLASSVSLEMRGTMRLKPGQKWMRMKARQIIAPPKGFMWRAEVGEGLMRFGGGDHYANGSGRVRFWLWRVIPLVEQEGPDVSRAALGRLVCETIWMPSSLLPQRGVKWEALDDVSARATMKVGEETTALTLFVEPDGRLREIRILRWGNQTEDGGYGYIPFGGQILEERAFGGYTIPSKVGVGWWIGTDRYFEFFRAQIEDAVFR